MQRFTFFVEYRRKDGPHSLCDLLSGEAESESEARRKIQQRIELCMSRPTAYRNWESFRLGELFGVRAIA